MRGIGRFGIPEASNIRAAGHAARRSKRRGLKLIIELLLICSYYRVTIAYEIVAPRRLHPVSPPSRAIPKIDAL